MESNAERSLGRLVDVAKSSQFEPLAHVVEIEAQLACSESSSLFSLGVFALLTRDADGVGILSAHDHDTIVVGDDHVAGTNVDACTDERSLYIGGSLLHRALGRDRL